MSFISSNYHQLVQRLKAQEEAARLTYSSSSCSASCSSSSSSTVSTLASSTIVSSSREIMGIGQKRIATFVGSSQLFEYVRDKKGAIARIEAVANKAETPKKLAELINLLNKGPMNAIGPLFQNADIDDLVVLAHLSGSITDGQLASVFYWKSAYKLCSDQKALMKEVPLFLKDGKINPSARSMMRVTVQPVNDLHLPLLTNEEIEKWFEVMRSFPPSEQRLLAGPRPETFTIMDAIYDADVNIFNRIAIKIKDNTTSYHLFPSMGMVTTLFGMVKDSQNIRPVYRFGATHSLRENGLRGERDILLRNPYQLTPKTADYLKAPWALSTSHDALFHLLLVNFVLRSHQRLFIELGDMLAKEAADKDDIQGYIADRFYDMECMAYRLDHRATRELSPVLRFSFSCWRHIVQAFERRQKAQETAFKGNPTEKEEFCKKLSLSQNAEENSKLRTAAKKKIVQYLTSKEKPSDFELQVAATLTSKDFDDLENKRYEKEYK